MDRIQTPTPAAVPFDVAAILTATATLLRLHPSRILTTNHLINLVQAAAPHLTDTELRPVWEHLPHHPDGDEHAEYAALLDATARGL